MDTQKNNAENQDQQQNPGTSLTPQQDYQARHAKIAGFGFPSIAEMQNIQAMAKVFHQSGALPKSLDTVPKLVMAIEAGREAGIPPIQAMNSFYIVNGRVTMFGETAIEQVLRYGHMVEWGECNDQEANVTITRGDNKKSLSSKFTMDMARQRGLTDKGGPWKTSPDNMLKFKAFHSIAKFIVPDALRGISIKEIYETEIMDGEIVEEKKTPNDDGLSRTTGVAEAATSAVEHMYEKSQEGNSLEDALNTPEEAVIEEMPEAEKPKSKRLKGDIISDIEKIIKEKNLDLTKAISVYKKTKLDDLTVEQLLKIEEAATMAPKKEKTDTPTKEESAGAKAMREAREKTLKADEGVWPQEVCKYLRFIEKTPDMFLPTDIIELKKDSVGGFFKGYEAYPSLKEQLESMPADFE